MIRLFVFRVAYLALPVYVIAAFVSRYAFSQSWTLSLAGVPLGMFIGGLLYCGATAAFITRRAVRQNNGTSKS
jgi:hypothetical protein